MYPTGEIVFVQMPRLSPFLAAMNPRHANHIEGMLKDTLQLNGINFDKDWTSITQEEGDVMGEGSSCGFFSFHFLRESESNVCCRFVFIPIFYSLPLLYPSFFVFAHTQCCYVFPGIGLVRDVGGATDRGAGSVEAMGTGYVFTVDNLLKMLSITLRLQVRDRPVRALLYETCFVLRRRFGSAGRRFLIYGFVDV